MAEKRRFTKSDKEHISEFIVQQHRDRKEKRKYFEKQICDIDRQLRMEPEPRVTKDKTGTIESQDAWQPESELPNQSQTLEVTHGDVMRLLGLKDIWFRPHVALTDDWLEIADIQGWITGDKNDVPTRMTQDGADKLVYGFLDNFHRQYDFRSHIGLIMGESIKYSMGVGRARMVQQRVFQHTTQGVIKRDMTIPMIVPRSIKHTYLDDNPAEVLNEGHIVSPGHIYAKTMRLKDIQLAAEKGNSDPDDMYNGGWVKSALKGLEDDGKGNVECLEWEGDMVAPRRTTDSLYLPNAIITVVIGKKGKDAESRIIRIRKNKYPFTSYILFPYFREHIESPYGSSPLIKGRPIQSAAVFAMNRVLSTAELNAEPPLKRDPDSVNEDPQVYPGALWDDDVEPQEIGDPTALMNVYGDFLRQYEDVTASNQVRAGAQAKSHTTAYARNSEEQRGVARTVDFSDDSMEGGLTRWLDIEYFIGRQNLKGDINYYIKQYGGFVTMNKKRLPEEVTFDVFGSGGPAEERAKQEMKMAAIQQAVNLDTLRMQQQMQLGQQPTPKLDLDAIIEETLAQGGITDVDALTRGDAVTQGTPGQSGVEGGVGGNPYGLATAALQGQNFGN